jgi:hypothetical protein
MSYDRLLAPLGGFARPSTRSCATVDAVST